MSTEQEVDAAPAPPPGEREQLIEQVTALHESLVQAITLAKQVLLRLDEIGAPVTRSRNRINKLDEVQQDWWDHFDYDVRQGHTTGSKAQQARAETYELS